MGIEFTVSGIPWFAWIIGFSLCNVHFAVVSQSKGVTFILIMSKWKYVPALEGTTVPWGVAPSLGSSETPRTAVPQARGRGRPGVKLRWQSRKLICPGPALTLTLLLVLRHLCSCSVRRALECCLHIPRQTLASYWKLELRKSLVHFSIV